MHILYRLGDSKRNRADDVYRIAMQTTTPLWYFARFQCTTEQTSTKPSDSNWFLFLRRFKWHKTPSVSLSASNLKIADAFFFLSLNRIHSLSSSYTYPDSVHGCWFDFYFPFFVRYFSLSLSVWRAFALQKHNLYIIKSNIKWLN